MFMNRFLKTVHFLPLFFVIIPALAIAGQYKVVRVVDGDTTVVDSQGKLPRSGFVHLL
jgi:endonuclease YncB( thermonuclease family)